MKLAMPDGEIVARYKAMAADQDRVGILAQLNNCYRIVIEDILARNGILADKPRRGAWGGTRQPSMNYTRAWELYNQGMTDAQMAQELCVADDTVRKWRKKNGLPVNLLVKQRHRRFQELHDQGLNDSEIARRCGVVPSTVSTWRRGAGLEKNL